MHEVLWIIGPCKWVVSGMGEQQHDTANVSEYDSL